MKKCETTRDLFAYAEDNRPSIVYKATNTITGHFYIGITRRKLEARKASHFCDALKRPESHFHKAIKRYGRQVFVFEVIANCPTYKDAAKEEIRLIASMKPRYNMTAGGDGVLGVGYRPTKATKKKWSKARKGKVGHWKGKKRSPESIEKMVATRMERGNYIGPFRGERRTSETVEKIIAARAKYRKWVRCVDDGKIYHGTRAAAEAYGLVTRSINDVCIGKARSIRGHRFEYVNESLAA